MEIASYEKVILAGVRGLTPEKQREVADFVYFLRQKDETDHDVQELIDADLALLEESELTHLEGEFANYEQLYPKR